MTPGEVAFTAYVTAVERHREVPRPILAAMWLRLMPSEQRAWESAAMAVLGVLTLPEHTQEDAPC